MKLVLKRAFHANNLSLRCFGSRINNNIIYSKAVCNSINSIAAVRHFISLPQVDKVEGQNHQWSRRVADGKLMDAKFNPGIRVYDDNGGDEGFITSTEEALLLECADLLKKDYGFAAGEKVHLKSSDVVTTADSSSVNSGGVLEAQAVRVS